MSTAWMLYWWTRLDSLNVFFAIGGTLLSILVGVFLMMFIVSGEKENSYDHEYYIKGRKNLKWSLPLAILFWLVAIAIPTSKDMAIIVGGQVATNIVQTPEAKELGNKAIKLINNELDSRLKDSKKDK